MTAMILEKVGFSLIYMTGYGTAAAMGMPDVSLATIGEMIRETLNTWPTRSPSPSSQTPIPEAATRSTSSARFASTFRLGRQVSYGGSGNARRSGHWAGKRLIPLEEAAGKIRATVDTKNRLDPDFVIVARTDARAAVGGGVDEAIRRGNAYADAGADLVFFESPFSEDEVARAAREIRVKLMILPGGLSPSSPSSG
jgi:2-methylisocitrate lyase-like PEP mutase family enzyme